MGLLEILTIVFIVLKLTGIIAWSWWLVLLPSIITLILIVLWFVFVFILSLFGISKASKW